ncbi:unnamed protein product [Schistosoma mattheei]|uniref:EF-hand domain-containing protein n=1 Tax=Schistosoma mattheei TaxID=31246 RepID=A0AA85ASV0_9TREM|nr:unnamed protein product [Schistosoma mattheei]
MQQPGVSSVAANVFNQIDRNRKGAITASELQQALSNGLGTSFNIKTIELMICMFDKDMNGTINVYEFSQLFEYVQQWQQCFRSYDRDGSGTIDCREFHTALTSFGYRLSPEFSQFLIRKFDKNRRGSVGFDNFILACVCLKNLTDVFRPYDYQRNGMAQLSYEQFLTAAFSVVS